MNIMVSDDSASLAYYLNRKPMEEPGFRVKTVKFYLDGALGSRGALLLDDYADDPGNRGLQLKPLSYFETMADSLSHVGWQMAIHAIGDSANRLAASIFSIGYAHNTDHRWRVEHAQIVHPEDQQRFKDLNIIPSIQPTHSTSDMYWADKRLGTARSTYAYPAKSFRDLGLETPLGTDFPVEDINPFYTLRAAMYRQDAKGYPADGFRPEEALSFKEALKGMTWSGAYASFEEDVKGLLKPGYYADFIVLKEDLSKVSAEEMGDVKVLATAINGEFLMAL
jgi:predicted amidohydrolase YtcJ